jgi:hypothetical protein
MSELGAKFKRCVNQGCELFRVSPPEFNRQRGLRDFLIDASEKDLTCEEFAVFALEQLCQRPPTSMDGVVCIAVIDLLDGLLGKPQEDPTGQRRATDLRELTESASTTQRTYQDWIRTWYG